MKDTILSEKSEGMDGEMMFQTGESFSAPTRRYTAVGN